MCYTIDDAKRWEICDVGEVSSCPYSVTYLFAGDADDSAGNNHGVITGATLTSDRFGAANEAYAFDGDDVILADTPFRTGNDDFTLAVWLSPGLVNDASWHGFCGYQAAGTRSPSLWVNWNGGGGDEDPLDYGLHWNTKTTQNGDGTAYGGVIVSFFQLDTYVHVVWTANAGEKYRFYKNGEVTPDGTLPAAAHVDLHDSYQIGKVDNWFVGVIDEVSFYNLAMNSADVAAVYAATSQGMQTALETRACEGDSIEITCGEGTINIVDATYGRVHGADVCPHSAVSNQECHAPESVNIVSAACQGQTTCVVQALNGVFGDPCGGTYKYLTVNYVCAGGGSATQVYLFAGNADDATGYSHGVVSGGASLDVDRLGTASSAYMFDGVDGKIQVATPFRSSDGDFSISIWLKPTVIDDGSWHGFVGYQDPATRSPSLWVNFNGCDVGFCDCAGAPAGDCVPPADLTHQCSTAGCCDCSTANTGNSGDGVSGNGMHWDTRTTQAANGNLHGGQRFAGVADNYFTSGVYTYVIWTKGGQDCTFYKNGASTDNTVCPTDVDLHETYDIGHVDNFFTGVIDEVAFYNYELSSDDAVDMFSASSAGMTWPSECPGSASAQMFKFNLDPQGDNSGLRG